MMHAAEVGPTMRAALLGFALGIAGALAACSENDGNGLGFTGGEAGVLAACPVRPSLCFNGKVPSYSAEVAPILAERCLSCHSPGRVSPDFTNQRTVQSKATTIRANVGNCLMPPAPLPPLSDDDYLVISRWIVGKRVPACRDE